jgi:hypothetical protein
MPVNPVVADVFRVALSLHDESSGKDFINVFYARNPNPPGVTQSDMDAIADAVHDAFVSNLMSAIPAHFELQQIVVTNLGEVNGHQSVYNYSDNGTNVTQALPYQTAAVISWRTDFSGKSFRGRSFIGGFAENQGDGMAIDPALVTALGEFAGDMKTAIEAADSNLMVVSRYMPNPDPEALPRSVPRVTNLANVITGFTVRTTWRTQRRRARV